ncbi:DUF2098 domain-containing protein [Methanolobus psychrotolerans]|uniref:DUF2098 domain-containing protein n=1 Tax=Methanolobus psychrotolerans TaxID=1874706 RepID=UPI000B9168DF|nr:DUF2098 domain-containing protein [Methanolobus psychrotolerans]
MEDSGIIEAFDIGGSPILIGSVVRYVNTGTVGKVIDLKEDDEGIWVMLDKTGLYYKPETLVIADASELIEEMKARTSVEDAESYIRSYGAGTGTSVDIGQVTGGG